MVKCVTEFIVPLFCWFSLTFVTAKQPVLVLEPVPSAFTVPCSTVSVADDGSDGADVSQQLGLLGVLTDLNLVWQLYQKPECASSAPSRTVTPLCGAQFCISRNHL